MNKFDYRKLDSYKAALDDGGRFHYVESLEPYNCFDEISTKIYKIDDVLYVFLKEPYWTRKEGERVYISTENFEEFKMKVEEYFTEGEQK